MGRLWGGMFGGLFELEKKSVVRVSVDVIF